MKSPVNQLNESALEMNLNELAHSLIRDLAMACRKMAIYGPSHPVAQKAVEPPFFCLDQIFRFKNAVTVNVQQGCLFAIGFRLKDSIFTEEIIRYLQILDATTLLIDRRVTVAELTKFLNRFVRRVSRTDHSNLLTSFLKKEQIDSIEVDTERVLDLTESQHVVRGDVGGDFSVRTMAMQQLPDELTELAAICDSLEKQIEHRGIDFNREVVEYLLPEKVASLPVSAFQVKLAGLVEDSMQPESDLGQEPTVARDYRSIWRLLDFHPERQAIIAGLQSTGSDAAFLKKIAAEAGDMLFALRMETSNKTIEFVQHCTVLDAAPPDAGEFAGAFRRLLKTGQQGKANETVDALVSLLSSTDTRERSRALGLLLAVVQTIDLEADVRVSGFLLDIILDILRNNEETFESAELIWRLWEKCLTSDRLDYVSRLAQAVGRRRQFVNGIAVYDSVAIKKLVETVNKREVVQSLITELIRGQHRASHYIRDIFISTGAEEVALGLSNIISHPDRQVRQQALKILAELGKASVQVCTQILVDDSLFEREKDRHELPDNNWFIIRNAIYVLGNLKDPEGVMPLRLRITDKDIRVRREIVLALEKIGGDDACDMLVLMADDPTPEIRERAIIAIGVAGTADTAPLLIDAIERRPQNALRGIKALGKLGGESARNYLTGLLDNKEQLEQVADFGVSKEEIRLAVVQALGNIGDQHAIDKLKEYKSGWSATQKILFKNSPVNKAVNEILSKK